MSRTSLLLVLVLSLVAAVAYAAPSIGAHDLPTLFYIAKSDDRNRVDYGARLDAQCTPTDSPIYAYWRRFEPGQDPLGDLNLFDQRAYGIAHQRVLSRDAEGSWIELGLRALPSRQMRVLVRRVRGRCVGAVQTTIAGREAVLDHVFVQLDGPMRVREVIVRGEVLATEEPIVERARP